jgi:hypothetical protein
MVATVVNICTNGDKTNWNVYGYGLCYHILSIFLNAVMNSIQQASIPSLLSPDMEDIPPYACGQLHYVLVPVFESIKAFWCCLR